MADTSLADAAARATRPVPSSMPATGGASLGGAISGVMIFHVNNVLLHYSLQPIPTEIASQYQIIIAALVGWATHWVVYCKDR